MAGSWEGGSGVGISDVARAIELWRVFTGSVSLTITIREKRLEEESSLSSE